TTKKNLISIILPAYNEEAIVEESIRIISEYLDSLKEKYTFEILIINDGSKDNTGQITDKIAEHNDLLRVIHHPVNLNLGRALQTGFKNAKGEVMIVMDMDLSYSVDHIEKLLKKQSETDADIVIASPYMKNGKVTGVPFLRALLSRVVNRFMRFASQEKYYTFTGMVRAYKTRFIKGLNLKTKDYEINPEILYKGMILRARIEEIPAHLDWGFQNKVGKKRTSGMNIFRGFLSGLMAGFIFRPYIFYISIGFILLLIALYIIGWILFHILQVMPTLDIDPKFIDDRFSIALGEVFKTRPHAFIVSGFTLLLAIQIISLGLLSLQTKRYYEELFHINSNILRRTRVDCQ
ncbi:MAG: glycosyltransferase family 2 protein, partial [Bacteroidales bacterium]|nr:glycosyltransferase family 2 protein [Bacteroidales bacterium]